MSLGLARDSIGNLADLDKSFGRSHDVPSMSSEGFTQEEGDSSEISLEFNFSEREDVAPKGGTQNTSLASNSASSYGHYTGFAGADYADYAHYGVTYGDNYSSSLLLGQKQGSEGVFWCCLFPWANKEKTSAAPQARDVVSAKSDDEALTGSAAYGEKLTEDERAAVLARLRLANPETDDPGAVTSPRSATGQKDLIKGVNRYEAGVEESKGESREQKTAPRSILRRGSKQVSSTPTASLTKKPSATDAKADGSRRRSLFPQQYEKKPKSDMHVAFAPMARVVTVKSKNEMTGLEKSMVWWQKPDYDDFKKTGRIIARAMCEGGSEIWLTSNNSWASHPGAGGSERAIHSHDRTEIERSRNSNNSPTNGDKWWHTFGHSRRGLEHIASIEEGRQRQANVRVAIRILIDEQRRQKIYRKEDPEKLRMLSLQYTSWARDLAIAAASSDAEAVQLNFDEKRKSREYYILKNARAHGGSSKQLPSFMMPVGRSPQVLDHHTSTQVRYRRKASRVTPQPQKSSGGEDSSADEPIHDARTGVNLAKKASGFGTLEKDMSVILSGMGAVDSKTSIPVIKPQAASVGAH